MDDSVIKTSDNITKKMIVSLKKVIPNITKIDDSVIKTSDNITKIDDPVNKI